MKKFSLVLQNGQVFEGNAPLWQEGEVGGEVVFTTGMTGYPETLTDPSYAGQIIVFTYPLIGNYGVPPPAFWESKKIHARGVIACQISPHYHHFQASLSFHEWLKNEGVFFLEDVDTRSLTKILRNAGSMPGILTDSPKNILSFEDPNREDLVARVSISKREIYGKGSKRVIAVDCGMKENMLRHLVKEGVEVVKVPYNEDYSDEDFDGVFLSNGPGDPLFCQQTIAILKKVMERKKPIFGVCLGNQLLALAAGATTYKLKFGHRGQNQPCIDLKTKKCYITSQNHGFAIDEKSLPADWEVTFRNLNDHSVEGISHRFLPFHSLQFHPEAAPGPRDTEWFFKQFVERL